MALAEVFHKEQGERANPILHGNGSPVPLELHDIDEEIMYSSCDKTHHVWHQDCVAGKHSRWFRSSAGGCCKAERTAEVDVPGLHWDVVVCSFQPQCKTEIPLGSSTTSHLQGSASVSEAGTCQCLSGVGRLWYQPVNWRRIRHITCLHQHYHVPPSAQEFWCPGNFGRPVKGTKINLDRINIP